MNIDKIKTALTIDTNNQFSLNAFFSWVKKTSQESNEKIINVIQGVENQVILPYFDEAKGACALALDKSNIQNIDDITQDIENKVLTIYSDNTTANVAMSIDEISNAINQTVSANNMLTDISNAMSSTSTAQEFATNLNILEAKYTAAGDQYAIGLTEKLKDYIQSGVDDNNWVASILAWIANLSNKDIDPDTDFDPTIWFDFSAYSSMPPFSAWLASVNINIDWNNLMDSIAGLSAAFIHGITELGYKAQQFFVKLDKKIKEYTDDPIAYYENDNKGKMVVQGINERLYTFTIPISSTLYRNLLENKIGYMINNGFPTLNELGITNMLNVYNAFTLNKIYHFDFPGAVISISRSDKLNNQEQLIITFRPKLYSIKPSWYIGGSISTHPGTISDTLSGLINPVTTGWQGYVETTQQTTDHIYANALWNGDIALGAIELALLSAATKAPESSDDTIPNGLLSYYTLTSLPPAATDHPGFGCPGMSQYANTNSITSQTVINMLESQLGVGDDPNNNYFTRGDYGYYPLMLWYSDCWLSYPIIALLCCYLVKENGVAFIPYIKSNNDVQGILSLHTTQDQIAKFSKFAKIVAILAGTVVVVYSAFKIRRFLVNRALVASSQYEQFYYKATTSNEDINKLRRMRFKSKFWNALAGVRVTSSDTLVSSLVDTRYSGSSYDFNGSQADLIIKLIKG